MESVMFFIRIPTQAEEHRLISESNSKIIDNNNYNLKYTPIMLNPSSSCLKDPDPKNSCLTNDSKEHSKKNSFIGSIYTIEQAETDNESIARKSWQGIKNMLSPGKQRSDKNNDNFDLGITGDTCMENVLTKILKKFEILDDVWSLDKNKRFFQITFTIKFNEAYDSILHKLCEWGIGDREGSSVSVVNCIDSKCYTQELQQDKISDEYKKQQDLTQKQGAWKRFMSSVRSRLNVTQILGDVRQDAQITFDFVVLLISASILASCGLAEDSTIFLASSMLISPLMGPIIAAIFGTVIKDSSLRSLGLKNELLGLLIATAVGFIFGIIIFAIDDRYRIGEGLTSEMISRCEVHSLMVGLITAIVSGAAAAIGILGGNIGSLIGVAISASLLPPAVNSGLLWALACIIKLLQNDASQYKIVKNKMYSDNQITDLAIMGILSMCLTISNIICVYFMGVLALKIKEIAPVISRRNCQFWKHDIKIARDINKNVLDTNAAIIDEFKNLPTEDQKALGINFNLLHRMGTDDSFYLNTWSPIGNQRRPINFLTVHPIEHIYSTIKSQQTLIESQNTNLNNLSSDWQNEFHRYGAYNRNTHPIKDSSLVDIKDSLNSDSNISKSSSETKTKNDKKHRKFIVTPAQDPFKIENEDSDTEV